MNAILVPGRPDKDQHYDPLLPSNSEDFWLGWLKRQLIIRDIHAVSIEPPFPFRPRYEEWKQEFERFDVTPETILVGHSCGGGFLVRWLSEHREVKVGTVVLVAPWMNPDHNELSDTADFFDFDIDADFPARTASTTVFISSDDDPSVVKSVEMLKKSTQGINYKEYTDMGHFTFKDSQTAEFPELRDHLLN